MGNSFYGTKLSENKRVSQEGYLYCLNAVVARTGFQTYKGKELSPVSWQQLQEQGIKVAPDDDVTVLRTEDAVFNPKTIASFEGKPLTITHPEDFLTVDTIAEHQCGHVQNVRRGEEPLESGDWPLLADIVVTDNEAIYQIEEMGVRELSCGYQSNFKRDGGNILQMDIIGNHVALVKKGRAGSLVSIKDSAIQEKRKMSYLSKMFAAWAKIAPADEIAEYHEQTFTGTATKDSVTKEAEIKHASDCPCKDCMPKTKDAAAYDTQKILDAVKRLVDGKAEEQKAMEDEDKESLAELTKMLNGGTGDSESDPDEQEETESTDAVIPPGDRQENLAPEAVDEDEEDPEGMNDGVIPPEDRQENLLPATVDAAAYEQGVKFALKTLKPFVARANNRTLAAAFDTLNKTNIKRFSKTVKASGGYGRIVKAAGSLGKEAKDSLQNQEQQKAALADALNKEFAQHRRKLNTGY